MDACMVRCRHADLGDRQGRWLKPLALVLEVGLEAMGDLGYGWDAWYFSINQGAEYENAKRQRPGNCDLRGLDIRGALFQRSRNVGRPVFRRPEIMSGGRVQRTRAARRGGGVARGPRGARAAR